LRFFEDHAVFDDFTGVVYDTSEGERIARILDPQKQRFYETMDCLRGRKRGRSGLVVHHYGPKLPGTTSCRGRRQTYCDRPRNALVTRGQVARMARAGSSFSRLWQRISREQPDLFD